MRIYRNIYSVHKWFGLATGIFLLLLGVSGSILVFKDELEHFLDHTSTKVVPTGKPLSLDSLYQVIVKEYPRLDGASWINPVAAPDESYKFRLYLNDAKLMTYDLGGLNINQYTGKIIRTGRSDTFVTGLMDWLFQFHFSFHLGMPGAALTAIMGICMLISIITGLIVYRKFIWKVLTFKVQIKTKNWRTISSDLHRIVGVWALLFNIVVFFTGFWMNLFAFETDKWAVEKELASPNTLAKASIDKMYQEARLKMPDLVPNYVYFPTQAEKKFNVRGNIAGQNALFAGGNFVKFDAQTGAFSSMGRFEEMAFWDKVEALFYPLHVGNYGGILLKILYVILGLSPALLSITGFLLWWRKVKK